MIIISHLQDEFFGFLLILIIKLRKHQQSIDRYLDVIVLSFLFAAIIGYIWSFLGGQTYGKPTHLPIGLLYKSEIANIPYTSAVIPLGILYSLACFMLFSTLYIFKEIQKIPGFTGYIGLWLFSVIMLIGEFYSWKEDIIETYLKLNINQLRTCWNYYNRLLVMETNSKIIQFLLRNKFWSWIYFQCFSVL